MGLYRNIRIFGSITWCLISVLIFFFCIFCTNSYHINVTSHELRTRLMANEVNADDIDISKLDEDERLAMLYRQRQVDTLKEYLQPIAAGLAKEMTESEREKEFGKKLTPETVKARQMQSFIPHDYTYPPTTELPFQNDILKSRFPQQEPIDHRKNVVYIPTREERFQLSQGNPSNFKERDPYRVLKSKYDAQNTKNNTLQQNNAVEFNLSDHRPLEGVPETLNDGWELLPCKTIFKHKLMYPSNEIDPTLIPNENSCVFVKFQFFDAETNRFIYSNKELGGDLLAIELANCEYGFRQCLLSMYAGEMAEFVMPFSEYNEKNRDMPMFYGVNWVRLWAYMNDCHDGTFKWWDLGPFDADLLQTEDYKGKSKKEYWEKRTDEMVENIKAEMANNPSSVYWHEALENMSDNQKKAAKDYFENECNEYEKMQHMEYSGSRGFRDAIKETGQFNGLDVGHIVGGRSTYYCYKENEFTIYLAIPVKPGIRAQHVNIVIQRYKLLVQIGNKTVLEDDLIGSIDVSQGTNWCMSDQAMKHEPLDPLPDETLGTTLMEDDFESVSKLPSIIIVMAKADHHRRIWGSLFEKI
ncbi:conserved Plasmodium protein, unknown function [Babesia microti strain RI]|uniref:CS domain-containing protein n=1 Tax=Babesia microti (strain RI) TaxID=1133968 RepID=A0A1N6LWW1_BABMR|nr:conserved Plasmodium protein, unknown function [Babesia microti strain RI]SIO73351.1 conserved Plasmodium protein, unknown function [Babesia microti strain RI]|eukprot:XP_021337453.1 conserved Plasmodium protein, unknown function [Babesia microti strain RI]